MNKDFGHVRHTRNPGNTTMTNQCFMISAPRPAYTFIISPPPYQSHRVRFAVPSAAPCQMLLLEHKDGGVAGGGRWLWVLMRVCVILFFPPDTFISFQSVCKNQTHLKCFSTSQHVFQRLTYLHILGSFHAQGRPPSLQFPPESF